MPRLSEFNTCIDTGWTHGVQDMLKMKVGHFKLEEQHL